MTAAAIEAACVLAKRWEGLRLTAYKCPAGIWTIGYGHTGPEVTEGTTCTMRAALDWLYADMSASVASAVALCPSLATGPVGRLAAIADFVFNLGSGRLRASTLRRRINNDEWDAVPGELRKWVYGGGRKLPGLILRREAEIACLTSSSTFF
jgi:lysozyme